MIKYTYNFQLTSTLITIITLTKSDWLPRGLILTLIILQLADCLESRELISNSAWVKNQRWIFFFSNNLEYISIRNIFFFIKTKNNYRSNNVY